MSDIQTRGNAAAIETVYEDLGPLVRRTARRFAKRYGMSYDEAVAEANLIFLYAYHSYAPGQGRLGKRVYFLIWHRLQDRLRARIKESQRLPCVSLYGKELRASLAASVAARNEAAAPPSELDAFDLDTRCLLGVISPVPSELAARLERCHGHEAIRRCVTTFLVDCCGWDRKRARRAVRNAAEWV